jgi:PPOX class probable F420-dependent enzyme
MTITLPKDVIEMIEGKNFGYISTISPDGWPHVTPVWVDREGDTLLINSTEGRKKVNNVQKNPKVSVAITDSNNPYRWVLIKGRVKEITTDGAEEHIDRLAKKYTGRDKYP